MTAIRQGLATSVLLWAACGGGSQAGDGGTSPWCELACLDTLVSLMAPCQPSGTCTLQLIGTAAENVCYSNGVKISATMTSSSSSAMSMSVKKNSTLCYSVLMSQTSSGDISMIFKNSSGATVATFGSNASADATVTCPGGAPRVLDSSCAAQASTANTFANSTSGSDCTQGTCAY